MNPSNPPTLASHPRVALFDLDGTLLPWDCQLLFRHHVLREEPWRLVFLPFFLAMLPFYPLLGDDGMKRVYLTFLIGMSRGHLERLANSFAARIHDWIYPELHDRLAAHLRAGDHVILASASPEFYVQRIGEVLGCDVVLGTHVQLGEICPACPDLTNHKGTVKVHRLREILDPRWWSGSVLPQARGYSDSIADLPMLGVCETAVVVNPNAQLEHIARENGWEILRPARPWRSASHRRWLQLKLLLGLGHIPITPGARRT